RRQRPPDPGRRGLVRVTRVILRREDAEGSPASRAARDSSPSARLGMTLFRAAARDEGALRRFLRRIEVEDAAIDRLGHLLAVLLRLDEPEVLRIAEVADLEEHARGHLVVADHRRDPLAAAADDVVAHGSEGMHAQSAALE